MKAFNYSLPTEILFGSGRIDEIAEVVTRFGRRCLVVTTSSGGKSAHIHKRVIGLLEEGGVQIAHFDGIMPNPTTDCITQGAEMAKDFEAEVVLGLGGGSSMDAAKAIAVECTHEGGAWDYRYFCEPQPTEKTLPIIAVTTTSGTGSEVAQVSVLTNPAEKDKSAIFNSLIYAKTAIVDPELTVTVPTHVTASTGFDVFTHAFESYLHPNASPYTDLMALEAIRLVAEHLPNAVENGENMEAREAMAWANTLAGMCIANAGVTLPHGIGMTIGGYAPHVMHGEALAVTYPEFTRYTYPYAVEQFANMGRIFDPSLKKEPDEVAAEKSCEALDAFMKRIGMWLSLEGLEVPEEDVAVIADFSQRLPDYKNNPRLATRDEIYTLLKNSYRRQ